MSDDHDLPPPSKQMRYNPRSSVNMPQSSTTLSETEFKDLNDDCLLKIAEFLKPSDLCALAKVNQRLSASMKYFIQLKYKCRFGKDFDFTSSNNEILNLEAAKAFLAIFGDEIASLKLSSTSFVAETDVNALLVSVQKYCHPKELTIKDFGIQSLNSPFFKQLEMLTLDNCSSNRNWCQMNQLKILELNEFIFRRWPLNEYKSLWPIPVGHFGSLEEVRLTECNLENDHVVKLITTNPCLKKVSVVKCLQTSGNIFAAVSLLKSLEEFEFQKEGNGSKLNWLKTLESIKTLTVCKLTFNTFSTLELTNGFVKKGVPLEHLLMGFGQFEDGTAENIGKLCTIKVLQLNGMVVNQSHLVHIVNKLELLQVLHVKTEACISGGNLGEIVRNANQLKELKIDALGLTFNFDNYHEILTTVQKRWYRPNWSFGFSVRMSNQMW